jgi:hypothetical protein
MQATNTTLIQRPRLRHIPVRLLLHLLLLRIPLSLSNLLCQPPPPFHQSIPPTSTTMPTTRIQQTPMPNLTLHTIHTQRTPITTPTPHLSLPPPSTTNIDAVHNLMIDQSAKRPFPTARHGSSSIPSSAAALSTTQSPTRASGSSLTTS